MMKKKYITEVGFLLTAVGGALQAYVQAVQTAIDPMVQVSGISVAMLSLGGALLGYRVSKKLSEEKEK